MFVPGVLICVLMTPEFEIQLNVLMANDFWKSVKCINGQWLLKAASFIVWLSSYILSALGIGSLAV